MTGSRMKCILLLALLLTATLAVSVDAKDPKAVTPESLGFSPARLARIDKAMQEDINQKKTGGIVVLIARHGTIVYHKAFGMADIEAGKKMQTDSLFRLYSMTKPVTSVALLTLYEEGKFQLTDPLEKYIPAFKDVKVFVKTDDSGNMVLEAPKRKITMQDVFRHTAGFAYGFGDTPVDKAYQQAGLDFAKLNSLKELVDKLAKLPLLYQPGERWVYSLSHDVQAYLVEYFSGMRFDKYVQSRILKPLGMKDAVFGIPKDYVARYTTNYGPKKEGGIQPIDKPESSIYARYTDHPFGGLSLSSTTMDYFRFAQMLLNHGKLDNARILGRKTVELMTMNHLPPQIPDIGMIPGTGYGLGVSSLINPALSGNLGSPGIFGWGGAASTQVFVDPKEDLVALYFTQLMPGDMSMQARFQTLVYGALID
ncbi:MAG TPA: serine hydrolase domain-containing protein [Acidobacteriota bacterium]|nr:serine hydrolase domain-containing protein [Acidobacteriota bacterium]